MKTWWKLYKIRVKAAWMIITGRYTHWLLIDLSEEELVKHFKEEDFATHLTHHKLCDYNVKTIIKALSTQWDEIDMLCAKVEFETEAVTRKKK